MSKDKLSGACIKCRYGNKCLGGCPNSRLTMEGSIYGDNKYCSYNIALSKEKKKIEKVSSNTKLLKKAKELVNNKSYQLAELILNKIMKSKGYNYEVYALYGFVAFMLENYEDAKAVNLELITKAPNDSYANKGYGMSLAKLGLVDEGIKYLKKAIELTKTDPTDTYQDLLFVLMENKRYEEARAIIEMGYASKTLLPKFPNTPAQLAHK